MYGDLILSNHILNFTETCLKWQKYKEDAFIWKLMGFYFVSRWNIHFTNDIKRNGTHSVCLSAIYGPVLRMSSLIYLWEYLVFNKISLKLVHSFKKTSWNRQKETYSSQVKTHTSTYWIYISLNIFFIEKMFNVNKGDGITTVIHILDANNFSFSH